MLAKLFIRLFDFLLFSNLFISICATVVTFQTFHVFNHIPNNYYLGFVFGGTLCSYNFHSLLNLKIDKSSPKLNWGLQFKVIQVVFMISGLMTAGFCFLQVDLLRSWLLFSILITFLYSAPLLEFPFFRNLKRIAVGKTAFLAFAWTFITCLLPLLFHSPDLKFKELLYVFSRFYFIYSICILFDYRDKENDKELGIVSLVTNLSERGIKFLFFASLMISIASAVPMLRGYSIGFYIAFILPVLILTTTFHLSIRTRSDYWYYFLLDGMMMLSGLLLIIFHF